MLRGALMHVQRTNSSNFAACMGNRAVRDWPIHCSGCAGHLSLASWGSQLCFLSMSGE